MYRAKFQNFRDESRSDLSAERLKALRDALARLALSGLLVPRADVFQGEYLPPSEDRVAYLTGFTGSAGFVIVTMHKCALFVDGRYTVQAAQQVQAGVVDVVPLAQKNPEIWLAEHAGQGAEIGYFPDLFTERGLARFERQASRSGFVLKAILHDPILPIWAERPAAPATRIVDHPLAFAGESREAKLTRLQKRLGDDQIDVQLISEGPACNWLFNIRAADVPHLPIARAFALVPRAGRAILFVDPKRLEPGLAGQLEAIADLVPPRQDGVEELERSLIAYAKAGQKLRLDEDSASIRFRDCIRQAGGLVEIGPDPIALMKAQKNKTEIAGAHAAHLRDGAAMVRFLAWLERTLPQHSVSEMDAAIALEGFRLDTGKLEDISFPSISAAGPNAALPHYRVNEASNCPITPGLYLIDSGGQYRDGTTDITRTIAVGKMSRPMRDAYTRVLKGMIAISLAVFPKGTSGGQLDAFARAPLWQAGLDFDHGTGHGVGSYLSVHEGPQRLSKLGAQALLPGMILSNEPGYYREGAFGIRIENLVVVEPRMIKGQEREMFGFETLTLCPIDTRPIITSMLTRPEKAWLNAYHAHVRTTLGPLVSGDAQAFLMEATSPI